MRLFFLENNFAGHWTEPGTVRYSAEEIHHVLYFRYRGFEDIKYDTERDFGKIWQDMTTYGNFMAKLMEKYKIDATCWQRLAKCALSLSLLGRKFNRGCTFLAQNSICDRWNKIPFNLRFSFYLLFTFPNESGFFLFCSLSVLSLFSVLVSFSISSASSL